MMSSLIKKKKSLDCSRRFWPEMGAPFVSNDLFRCSLPLSPLAVNGKQ